MIEDILNGIGSAIEGSITWLLDFLPDSPFTLLTANDKVKEVLGYVNYFIPFDYVVTVGSLWLVAIGIFYAYQAVLRWINAIE